MKNYYEILEVDIHASKEMIERAFKLLAKRYHPDTQEEAKKAWAEEKFKEINEAYELLSDPQKKKEYDAELEFEKNSQLESLMLENEQLKHVVMNLQTQIQQSSPPQQQYIPQEPVYRVVEPLYYETPITHSRFKSFIAFLVTIITIVGISFLLWKIPFTHDVLVDFYQKNAVIRNLVDMILSLF